MRVVLSPSAFHPSIGGVEVATARLGAELVRRGHAVEIWTNRLVGTEATERVDGMAVRRFGFDLPAASPVAVARWCTAAPATVLTLRRELRRFRPDLLHVHCFSGNGAWILAAARSTRIPLVVSVHGETAMDDADIYRHSAALRAALRSAMAHADAFTGCSRFALDHAQATVGRRRLDAEVVFNGTDTPGPPAAPVWEPPFGRYVAAIGRVVPNKGFDLLLDAFSRLRQPYEKLGLVIGGGGAALQDLARRAERLGIADRVAFTGPLSACQVAAVMEGALAVVMPSRVEPFGMVALEAWRSGCPVVVSSRGGAPEFVTDGLDGLVVDPYDAAALADALARLVDDEQLAARLSAAGRERLAGFTWQAVTDRYEDVYRRACRLPPYQ